MRSNKKRPTRNTRSDRRQSIVKRDEAGWLASTNAPTPDDESPLSLSPCDRDKRWPEMFVYSRDAALVGLANCAKFLVGQNEYWLDPVPLHPERSVTLVIDTMVELSYDPRDWLPVLLKSAKPILHTLGSGGQCVLALDKNRKSRHIDVEYHEGTLIIRFPPFGEWTAASLNWMIDNGCPCGYLDCNPAPWRGTPCRYLGCHS